MLPLLRLPPVRFGNKLHCQYKCLRNGTITWMLQPWLTFLYMFGNFSTFKFQVTCAIIVLLGYILGGWKVTLLGEPVQSKSEVKTCTNAEHLIPNQQELGLFPWSLSLVAKSQTQFLLSLKGHVHQRPGITLHVNEAFPYLHNNQ